MAKKKIESLVELADVDRAQIAEIAESPPCMTAAKYHITYDDALGLQALAERVLSELPTEYRLHDATRLQSEPFYLPDQRPARLEYREKQRDTDNHLSSILWMLGPVIAAIFSALSRACG